MEEVIKELKKDFEFSVRKNVLKFETFQDAFKAQIFIMNSFPDIACPLNSRKIYLTRVSKDYVEKRPSDYSELKTIPVTLDDFISSLCSELHEFHIKFKLKKKKNKTIFRFGFDDDRVTATMLITGARKSGFEEIDQLWEEGKKLFSLTSVNKKIIIIKI